MSPGHIVSNAAAMSRNIAIVSLCAFLCFFSKWLPTDDRAVSVFLSDLKPCWSVYTEETGKSSPLVKRRQISSY